MPGRRPLVALIALFVVPLPACIHVSAQVDPTAASEDPPKALGKPAEPAQPRLEFASLPPLPRVPGTAVLTKAANPNPAPNSTALKPNPTNPPPVGPPKSSDLRLTAGEQPPSLLPPMAFETPMPSESPLLGAVRAYSEGRPERAIEIIRTLNPQNQDVLLTLLPILAQSASADLNNDPAMVAAMVGQLHSAASRLEPRAALRIEKSAFCHTVDAFGRFVPRPDNLPYKPNAQVQLYLEVRNLGSQPVGDGFVTSVQAAVEVKDAYGKPVEQIDPDDRKRRVPVVKYEKRLDSRSPLHDFHVLYIFSAPAAPGVYTITVELRDATGRRTVKTQPAQFCVAGP